MRPLALVLVAVSLVVLGACSKTRADEGRDAILQIEGAQFYRGALPSDEDALGPRVVTATASGQARAGEIDQAVSGELETSANAVALALGSDVGYWILPATIPSISAPTSPTFTARFGIAATAPVGPRQLVFRAVDGAGRFGPPLVRPLAIQGRLAPVGRFVVSLTWENEADLDLHVVLPNGIEIYKRNRTEYQRPPASAGPVPPNAPTDGGVLDRDSNAQCVLDGQQAEDVVWKEPPPKGHYVVRVDTFSLCGAASSPWHLVAVLDGVLVGAAQGTSTDADVRFDHNRGGGVLALELDVP